MSWDGGKSLLYPNPHSPPLWHTMVESGRGGTPLYVTLTLPAFASPPAPAHQTNKHLLRFPSFSRYIHPSTPLQTKLIIGETSSVTDWHSELLHPYDESTQMSPWIAVVVSHKLSCSQHGIVLNLLNLVKSFTAENPSHKPSFLGFEWFNHYFHPGRGSKMVRA